MLLRLPIIPFLGLILWGLYWALLVTLPPIADEATHLGVIQNILAGKWSATERVPMIPTFHALIASFLSLFPENVQGILTARSFSFLLALLLFLPGVNIARHFSQKHSSLKAWQLLLCPLLFILTPLVYTDLLALLFLLRGLHAGLLKKQSAYIWIAAASLIRQSHAIWTLALFLYGYLSRHGTSFSIGSLWNYLRSQKVFLSLAFLGLLYILWNQGIAFGLREHHPTGSFSLGNIIFTFFLLPILFPLETYACIKEYLKKHGLRFFLLILLLMLCVSLCFTSPHPLNRIPGFLRNELLMSMTSSVVLRIVFQCLSALGLVLLCAWPFQSRKLSVFLLTALPYLAAFPLIEQRYAIPVIAMLILFRRQESIEGELRTALIFALQSAAVLVLMSKGYFL